jgi:hypothetical protein
MDVILRLFTFSCVLVGFGEGVCETFVWSAYCYLLLQKDACAGCLEGQEGAMTGLRLFALFGGVLAKQIAQPQKRPSRACRNQQNVQVRKKKTE